MMENSLREKVLADIDRGQKVWEDYSHDGEKMAELFHHLIGEYQEEIEGFSRNFAVIQPTENSAKQAEAYRGNVALMLQRLQMFEENGFSNEGLWELYFKKERTEVKLDVDFLQLRMEIDALENLCKLEKDEIIRTIGEMEEIFSKPIFKREKWNLLRGYLIWLSGKDVDVAMKILPLFFKINQ